VMDQTRRRLPFAQGAGGPDFWSNWHDQQKWVPCSFAGFAKGRVSRTLAVTIYAT
jgi:hypothetical protein